ncbi:hypothetical protein ABIG06_001554 [Bradyrhizobium sp. USDA 326]
MFEIEHHIYGPSTEERLQIRRERSAQLLTELETWLLTEFARLSHSFNMIKPIDNLLNSWEGFAHLVHDGRICMTTDGVEKPYRQFKATFFGFSFQAATIRSSACSTRAT